MPDAAHSGPAARSLRELACLAHTVPGVTVRLHCHTGAELLVSYSCLGADLTPCRLRMTLLHEAQSGRVRLAERVDRVEIVAGLRTLGAGLYERRGGDTDERWFVSALEPELLAVALAEGPDRFHTTIKPDLDLGVHAVRLAPLPDPAIPPGPGELDEAAVWALATVLTAELAAELQFFRPPPTNR